MPIPSLQCLMMRSRGFGRRVVFSKICYNAVIVLSVVLCLQTNLTVEIEFLATVGWKCDCQPFSCRCSQNGTHCRKEICWTFLFKESIPAIPFGSSQHPVPTRSLRFLRVEVRSTSSTLWLHHAHPFVAAAEKDLFHAEKQRVWSRSCGLQDLLQYSDCALSRAM